MQSKISFKNVETGRPQFSNRTEDTTHYGNKKGPVAPTPEPFRLLVFAYNNLILDLRKLIIIFSIGQYFLL